MSQEQLKAFMEKVKEDKELQEKLAALPKDDIKAAQEAGVAIAQASGFDVELADVQGGNDDGSLTEDQLESVAGGTKMKSFKYPCGNYGNQQQQS